MLPSTAALAYLKLLKRIRKAKGQQGEKKGLPRNPRKGHDRKRWKSEITVTHPNLYLQEPPSMSFHSFSLFPRRLRSSHGASCCIPPIGYSFPSQKTT